MFLGVWGDLGGRCGGNESEIFLGCCLIYPNR